MNNKNKYLKSTAILALFSWGIQGCSSGSLGSDVGGENDIPPTARLAVIGASEDGTEVRAGSKIVLTAKNSIPGDNPVVGWSFSVSGAESEELQLVEVAANSRSIEIPHVQGNPTWDLTMTLFDSEGNSSTDTKSVSVASVADVERFLSYRELNEFVDVVVALSAGQATDAGGDSSFEAQIESVLIYPNRDAVEQTIGSGTYDTNDEVVIDSTVINGSWPVGLTVTDTETGTYNPESAFFNPRFRIRIPLLDIEDVNSLFEQSDRNRRLDPWKVDSAFVELRVTLTAEKVMSQFDAAQLIFVPPGSTAVLASINTGESVGVEDLRVSIGSSASSASADAYNSVIDGGNDNSLLSRWLFRTGFSDENGVVSGAATDAHAIYLNNYDLGFGRDMYVRTDEFGNVYSFVTNYPTLENAIDDRKDFLTVAMEYSPPPSEPLTSENKFVKFFAFVPDETGDSVRVSKANFDGRGERFLPGACTVCHGGQPKSAADYDPMQPLSADLNSSFMPWDLDAFLYSDAADPDFVDPEFTVADGSVSEVIDQSDIQQYSRESQESAFKAMNMAVLSTYEDYVDQARIAQDDPDRFVSSIDLVNGWYSDSSPCGSAETFCGDYVPMAWQDSAMPIAGVTPDPAGTYANVFARNCRACHVQIQKLSADPDEPNERDFDSYDEFVNHPLLDRYVYGEGYMPFARLTADRFWVDFHGGPSAGSLLQSELNISAEKVPGSAPSFGETLESSSVPEAQSVLARGGTVVAEIDENSPGVNSIVWQALTYDIGMAGTVCANVNGAASFLSSSSPITTASNDSGSSVASHAAFLTDVPGSFTLTANVVSDQGNSEVVTIGPFIVDNNCPTPSAMIGAQSIQLGGTDIVVDLSSFVGNPGDGLPSISINDFQNINVEDFSNNSVTISCQANCDSSPASVGFRITDVDGDFADGVLPIEVTAAAVPNGPGFDATSPPVNDLVSRTQIFNAAESLNIDVLARTSGGTGDRTVSVTSGSMSQESGTVNLNGGVVTYTPALGFVGIDSFTYNVTDSNPAQPQTSAPDGRVDIHVDGTIVFGRDIEDEIFETAAKNCVNCHRSNGGAIQATKDLAMADFSMDAGVIFDETLEQLTATNDLFTYPPSAPHTGSGNATNWGSAADCNGTLPENFNSPYCVFLRWSSEGACDLSAVTNQPLASNPICPKN